MGTKLYIQNLAPTIDAWELESWFTVVGDVASVSVSTLEKPSGNLRVGYVEMATPEQAADGIDRFNGKSSNGLTLIVREDKVHVPSVLAPAKSNRSAAFKRKGNA
ncbi:MAG TPA: RNA-binding protein [Bdellovibrionales bacterium]|nr:RNA-binding protein [Bdellovibrionales bacterium]